jgi:hypothetical protein
MVVLRVPPGGVVRLACVLGLGSVRRACWAVAWARAARMSASVAASVSWSPVGNGGSTIISSATAHAPRYLIALPAIAVNPEYGSLINRETLRLKESEPK